MKNEQTRPLTLQQAAGIAGVFPDTVARWCKGCTAPARSAEDFKGRRSAECRFRGHTAGSRWRYLPLTRVRYRLAAGDSPQGH